MATTGSVRKSGGIADKQARDSLLKLVEYVFEERGGPLTGISYQALAARIGRMNKNNDPAARGMGDVLGRMGRLLQGVEVAWGEKIPHLQCLAVLKSGGDAGLPDVGLKEFWPEYETLSRLEKESKLAAEYKRIQDFASRWNKVLEFLQLPVMIEAPATGLTQPRGGGESPEHKALKLFVQKNPHLVGAGADWFGIVEYALPSLDEIDVFFKSPHICIAVEVKSSVSDRCTADYERGIYQAIKYKALLKAMVMAGRPEVPGTIRSVLLLQSKLPDRYRALAEDLKVEVIESVIPTDGNRVG